MTDKCRYPCRLHQRENYSEDLDEAANDAVELFLSFGLPLPQQKVQS